LCNDGCYIGYTNVDDVGAPSIRLQFALFGLLCCLKIGEEEKALSNFDAKLLIQQTT